MYDCYHGLAPSYFGSYFTPVVNTHHYDTRAASCGDLFLQRNNTIFMVSDQFSTLEQDCGIFCLHQLGIHNLPQYLDHKLKPYSFHITWKTDASTHEIIVPPTGTFWTPYFLHWSCLLGCLAFLLCMACLALSPWARQGPKLWLSCG